MDSVDGCCGPRKTEVFQSTQADSSPQKVDLIIWEIEVPKVSLQVYGSLQAQVIAFGRRDFRVGIINQ